MKPRLITVHWIDSAQESGWVSVNDLNIDGTPCISRGFLLDENEDWVLIAGHIGLDADGHVEQALGVVEIPKVAITSYDE